MKLTFKDRLTILYSGLLPQFSTIEGIKINKSVKEKVAFSEKEQTLLALKDLGNGNMSYLLTVPVEAFAIDAEFSPAEIEHLKNCANAVAQSGRVSEDTIETIEKLIAG